MRHLSFLVGVFSVAMLPAQAPRFAEVGEALPDGIGQVFASADYEGDGDVDLFSTTGVYLNENGYFRPGPRLPAGFVPHFNVRAIAARDFTGDGLVDVLVGRLGGAPSGLALFVAPPAGGAFFAAQATAIGGQTGVYEFVADDFDGDGDEDVVAANSSSVSQTWVWLQNDGSGGFAAATAQQWPLPSTSVSWLGTGDFDGDGRLDIVAATPAGPVWRRNLGGGAFGTSQQLPALLGGVDTGVVGDFDGDGYDDLLLVDVAGNDQRLRGSVIGPVTAGSSPGVGVVGAPMLAQDLDGDGRDEILRSVVQVSGAADGELTVMVGTAAGPAPGVPIGAVAYAFGNPTPYAGVAVADIDGDGDQDLMVAPGGQAPWVIVGGGISGPQLLSKVVPAGFARQIAPPRDIDWDGAADLLTATLRNGVVQIAAHHNDGRGNFATDATPIASFAASTAALAGFWQDLDADGAPDLLLLNPLGPHFLLRNDVVGTFSLQATIQGVGRATAVAFGDFDGDLLVDIVIARAPTAGFPVVFEQPVLLRAIVTPAGISHGPPVAFGLAEGVSDIEVLDLGADGDLDLVVATGTAVHLYENDGLGGFSALPPLFGAAAASLAVGDLDADGDADLVLGGQTWLWQGAAFAPSAVHQAPIGELSLADADEDGDLDLFDSAGASYENDGSGAFGAAVRYVPHALSPLPSAVAAGAPVDLDADGDLDIVAPIRSSPGHFTVYANLTRHVARDGLGVPGDAQRMVVYGRAGDLWFLAASLPSVQAVPLPPLGRLFLDPATLVVLAGGVMPAGGSAAFALPLPLTAGGTTLTWQALVGSRFTNATDTRILP